jgi:hypothetical protein
LVGWELPEGLKSLPDAFLFLWRKGFPLVESFPHSLLFGGSHLLIALRSMLHLELEPKPLKDFHDYSFKYSEIV